MAKIYCSNCGKEIKEDEEFIVVNDNEVYCGDCTEEDTFTTYRVGGECVGDETDTDEHTINFYKRKLEIAKSRYNDHFGEEDE